MKAVLVVILIYLKAATPITITVPITITMPRSGPASAIVGMLTRRLILVIRGRPLPLPIAQIPRVRLRRDPTVSCRRVRRPDVGVVVISMVLRAGMMVRIVILIRHFVMVVAVRSTLSVFAERIG